MQTESIELRISFEVKRLEDLMGEDGSLASSMPSCEVAFASIHMASILEWPPAYKAPLSIAYLARLVLGVDTTIPPVPLQNHA